MAALSNDLAGLVLPHDHYGNHLNSSGQTIDIELEKMNFFKTVEVLSEVQSQTAIDGYPVQCNAVVIEKENIPPNPDPVWVSNHCLQSRYSYKQLGVVIVPVVHRLKPVDSLSLTTALYHSQQYAKHVMYAGEPLVYSEGPNNLRNFTPLFERLLYKNIQQKVLNMKTSNSIFTVPR